MKILFVCNTLYQIIVASCIRKMFPKHVAEIILSDHSTANRDICRRFQETGLIFDKTYYVKTKYLYDYDGSMSKRKRIRTLQDKDSVLEMVELDEKYDMFFCANAEPFTERIVNYVKRRNPNAIINWFEDGISAYDYDKCYFPSKLLITKWKIKRILTGIINLTSIIDNFYVFEPNKMEWKPNAKLKRIDALSQELISELNVIFNFRDCIDKYEEKYIFFEDGASEWNDNTNLELLEIVASIVGKENIIVKIHPRNPVNKFESKGFKTNKDMSIPWEIITSNIDIENKILITMYSQSVITPDILLGKNGKALVLGKLNKKFNNIDHTVFDYMEKHYFNENPSRYCVPETIEDMKNILIKI